MSLMDNFGRDLGCLLYGLLGVIGVLVLALVLTALLAAGVL